MSQHLRFDPTIEHVVQNYRPRVGNPYTWLEVAPFVRDVVSRCDLMSADHAARLMNFVSGYAMWAADVAGYPLEIGPLFRLEPICEYAHSRTDLSDQPRSNVRSRLKFIARQVNPEWDGDARAEYAYGDSSTWHPNPYTAAETAIIAAWAAGQRTERRRLTCHVLLALTLGAGLWTHEVARLRVGDIETDDDGVVIRLRFSEPREVPVRRAWEAPLVELVNHVGPEHYAFQPGRTNRKSSVVANFVKGTNSMPACGVSPQRLRATWVVSLIQGGVPASVILKASGMKKLRNFERWWTVLPDTTRDEFRAWMREGQRP